MSKTTESIQAHEPKEIEAIRAYVERSNVDDDHTSRNFSCRVSDIVALAEMPDHCEAVMLAFDFGRAKGVRMERKRAAARKAGEV